MLNNSFIKQYCTLNPIIDRSSMLPFLVPLDSAQIVFSRHFYLFSVCLSFLSPSPVRFNSPFIIRQITMALLTNELRFSACHQPSLDNLLLFHENASVVTLLTHCQSTYFQVYRIHGMPTVITLVEIDISKVFYRLEFAQRLVQSRHEH